MDRVELQILQSGEYKSVELDQKSQFSINIKASTIEDPTAVKINYSDQIEVPVTANNNVLFDSLFRVDSVFNKFDTLKRVSFRLYVNYNLFESGYMQLEEIDVQNRLYKIRLYGGLGDFFYALSETSLRNLNFDGKFQHTIDVDELKKLFESNGSQDYGYALTYQGEYDNFDTSVITDSEGEQSEATWSEGATYTAENMTEHDRTHFEEKTGEAFAGEYRTYYQRPMIKFSTLFEKVLESLQNFVDEDGNEASWETELDPEFFNDENPYYSKLWILCPPYTVGDSTGAPAVKEELYYNASRVIRGGLDTLSTIIIPPSEVPTTLTINLKIKLTAINQETDKNANYLREKREPLTLFPYLVNKETGGSLTGFKWTNAGNITDEISLGTVDNISQGRVKLQYKRPGEFGWGNFAYSREDGSDKKPQGENPYWYVSFSDTIPASNVNTVYDLRFNVGGSTYWYTRHSAGAKPYDLKIEFEGSRITIGGNNTNEVGRSGSEKDYTDIITTEHTGKDLVLSYCKMFGLVFKKDLFDKKVSILLRENFFDDENTLDWTYQIDYSKRKDFRIEPIALKFKKGVFRYNELDTKYEQQYRLKTGKEYGSITAITGYEFSNEEYNYLDGIMFDNCIIATGYSRYFKGRNENNVLNKDNKELPYFQDENGDRIESDYTLAFWDEASEVVTPFLLTDDNEFMASQGYSYTNYGTIQNKYPKVLRTIEVGEEKFSLNFGKPSESYADSEIFEDNATIYWNYWKAYIYDRTHKDCKVLECYVFLSENEIQNDILSKFVYFDNTIWVIDEIIGYNPLHYGSTKVRLIKVNDKKNYLDRYNISDDFKISYNGDLIFDNASGEAPKVIYIDESTASVTLDIDGTVIWTARPDGDFALNPTFGPAGPGSTTLTLPLSGTLFTTVFNYGSGQKVNIVIVRNRYVTVTATTVNGTQALINGLQSPQTVRANSNVTFTATSNTEFLYWIINGEQYDTPIVQLTVTENTTATAYFLSSGQVKLYCDDPFTTISGQNKIENYWILNVGQSYNFQNSQEDFSAFVFSGDNTFYGLGAHVIKATDTYLRVIYGRVLLNVIVINESEDHVFDSENITIVGSEEEEEGEGTGLSFSVAPGEEYKTIADVQPGSEITFTRYDYHYPTFFIRDSLGNETPVTSFPSAGTLTLVIYGNRVGWEGDESSDHRDGDNSITLEEGGEQEISQTVYAPIEFTLTYEGRGVEVTPESGTEDTEVTINLSGYSGKVIQHIGEFEYELTIDQPGYKPIGWDGDGTINKTVNIPYIPKPEEPEEGKEPEEVPPTELPGDLEVVDNLDGTYTLSGLILYFNGFDVDSPGDFDPGEEEEDEDGSKFYNMSVTFPENDKIYPVTLTYEIRVPDFDNTVYTLTLILEPNDLEIPETDFDHVVPSESCTYDIGTEELTYKDGYFCGTVYGDRFEGTAANADKVSNPLLFYSNAVTIRSYDGSRGVGLFLPLYAVVMRGIVGASRTGGYVFNINTDPGTSYNFNLIAAEYGLLTIGHNIGSLDYSVQCTLYYPSEEIPTNYHYNTYPRVINKTASRFQIRGVNADNGGVEAFQCEITVTARYNTTY